MASYNLANSLSPMMFRKQKKSDQGGTRNERLRSKSVENITDTPNYSYSQLQEDKRACAHGQQWKEIHLLKTVHPVVACVLPSLSMDFVASAVLAIGGTPLIAEDAADMENNLDICKAVIVDMSAPSAMIEAFIECFEVGCKPLVLVASDCGTCDRKKDLAEQIIQKSGPNFITGKLVDIHSLAMVVLEKSDSRLGSSTSDDEEDRPLSVTPVTPSTPTTPSTPKVVLSTDNHETNHETNLPPALRRARMRRSTSPAVVNNSAECSRTRKSGANSPSVSPYASPRTSPPDSVMCSPHASPRSSPVPKWRGIRKFLGRKKKSDSDRSYSPLKRVPTAIPRLRMKGQFRDSRHHSIKNEDGLESAQNLAARTNAFVHIFEMGVVTSGEVIVEINNNQLGMGNLHSILPVCGAITTAVLACALGESDEDITLSHCVHGLALYCVAVEEGGACTVGASEKGVVSPGTLRVKFLDALHYTDEETVRAKAELFAHTEGIKSQYN